MPRKKAETSKVSETKKKSVSTKKSISRKKPITRKKPEPKPTFKRKELTHEEMFPYKSFIYRLEYQDGTEHRICHFQCEEHRTKHIERYKLRKGTYFIDSDT